MHPPQPRSLVIIVILTGCVILLAATAFSQSFQFRTYSFSNSLSSYNAGKIIQDNYGFIWVCTQEGINRFDGKQFIAIKKQPFQNTGLSENYVTDAARDENGNLWIATALGGVDELNPETFSIERRLREQKGDAKGLMTDWIRSLSFSKQHELWVGTYYGLNIYNKERQEWLKVTANPFNEKNYLNVSFLAMDSLQNMWLVAENDGIIIYNTSTKQIVSTIGKKQLGVTSDESFTIYCLFIDSISGVYACTNKGLKHIRYDGKKYLPDDTILPLFRRFSNTAVKGMIRDDQGRFYIGTEKGVAVINKDGSIETLTHSNFFYNTILDDDINALFKDAFGNIWVTTTKGLNLLINNQYHFQAFTAKTGGLSTMGNVNTLYPDNDSIIYACAANGIFKVNTFNFRTDHLLEGNQYGEIESIIRLNSDGFLVSSNQELLYLTDKDGRYTVRKADAVFSELAPAQNHYFSTMARYNDSIILLASMEEEGLFKWDIKNHLIKQFKGAGLTGGPYEDNFHNIKKDRKGNIWLLSNLSITKYDPLKDKFKNYYLKVNSDNAPHFFFDLYDDGRHLWITSYGSGLIRFDPANDSCSFFTEKDGFTSNAMYSILPENDSAAWISSNRGLTRFNFQSAVTSRYFSADGLQSDAFDERSSCRIGSTLFMGGLDGFTSISYNKDYRAPPKIPVYVGKIVYQDAAGQQVTINSLILDKAGVEVNGLPITFQIISPDYRNNNSNRYAYKIKELNDGWVPLGESSEITLAGLSPGNYHFQARIYNADHAASASNELVFTVLPKWYQTLIFRACAVCFAVLVIFLIYRLRIAQLKKQQRIRQDIASDLHDDIGSTLNSIKIFVHLLRVAAESQEQIDRIKESLTQATAGLRDLIWVLEDKNDTVDDLVNRVKMFAGPYTRASNVLLICRYENTGNERLRKTEKRNLLLIAKEAINNSIKYAQCSQIEISFSKNDGKLCMTLKDNGNGFVDNGASAGNGLRNMQLRARQLKSQCTINSKTGEGTTVTITVRR